MNVTFRDKDVNELTLERATRPQAITIRKMLDEYGHEDTLHAITLLLMQCDSMLGNEKPDYDRLQTIAANAMYTNSHRSFGFLIVSLREGMMRTDKDGKGFNKVTVQLVAEWTTHQERKLIGLAEDEHAKNSVRGDNWRSEDVDRLERTANRDKARISHLSEQLRDLKERLNEKQ